ncbi:hypothetical protein NQ317_013884 [Molorchus minor]|uniref:Palmitoyltransferase n=1 Tax=Molorchus minor TaxID=1323400 RepID=A0ABQ9K901_9CUCU|nr:hypothetical protein NQ317_013884 [Molorchus minor]
MNNESIPLCCCEYYNVNNERSHVLLCCCNCTDLDEAFESLISAQGISQQRKQGIMTTVQDRMRIPWRGGAKQIAFDAMLPIFIIPTMLLVASISLWWTVFSFTTVNIFLMFIYKFLIRTIPHTKFFFVWTVTTLVASYIIFEFIVIPFLEILLEENIALSLLIFGFILCLYLLKVRTNQLFRTEESQAEIGKVGIRVQSCNICQIRVPDKNHHCVWFDCCIGNHNHCLFILSLFFGMAALLYSSNLTLTSVCHPFTLYHTILLPDDCSDVYKLFELSLSFVAALYSLFLAIILLFLFLQQILLVSIGMTMKEWQSLPFISKLCLGMTAKKPHNQGFLKNWRSIICWSQYNYNLLN